MTLNWCEKTQPPGGDSISHDWDSENYKRGESKPTGEDP